MYIYFGDYPPYSGRISENFETNDNANMQCYHVYACSSSKQKMWTWFNGESWEIMKNCFPDAKQIKKCPKTTVCKECTYVQKDRNDIDENFDSPPDN